MPCSYSLCVKWGQSFIFNSSPDYSQELFSVLIVGEDSPSLIAAAFAGDEPGEEATMEQKRRLNQK
jgi:hypothetical protein